MHACEIAERPRHWIRDRSTTCRSVVSSRNARGRRDGVTIPRACCSVRIGCRTSVFASVLRRSSRARKPNLRPRDFCPLDRLCKRSLTCDTWASHTRFTLPFAPGYRREFRNRRHGQLYGYSNPERPTEVVNIRVEASGTTEKPRLPFSQTAACPAAAEAGSGPPGKIRRAHDEGRDVPVGTICRRARPR